MRTHPFTLAFVGTVLAGCSTETPRGPTNKESATMPCCSEGASKKTESSPCCGEGTSTGTSNCCAAETAASTAAPAATAIHRPLEVEFLFLDLKLCERCQGTEKALEESVAEAAKILGPTGVDVTLKMTHVETEKDALRLAFVSSPTVRVNGRDVALEVKENACSGCSSLCGSEISCRVWTWQGREYSIPPKAMLLDAILKDAYVHASDGTEARAPIDQVPDNLKRFFQGSNRGGP